MLRRVGCGALALLMGLQAGCTALRQIPPTSYGEGGTRRDVVAETTDGRRLEFEEAHAEGDTLVGYRRADEDTTRTLTETRIPFEQLVRLSRRSVDWTRTGLIGGALVAGVVVFALTRSSDDAPSGGDGGGKPPPTLAR